MYYKDIGRDTYQQSGTTACSILMNQGNSLYHFSFATFTCSPDFSVSTWQKTWLPKHLKFLLAYRSSHPVREFSNSQGLWMAQFWTVVHSINQSVGAKLDRLQGCEEQERAPRTRDIWAIKQVFTIAIFVVFKWDGFCLKFLQFPTLTITSFGKRNRPTALFEN